MNGNTSNINDGIGQNEGFDFKKFIYLILRQWYWFALFGAMGLICAYGYNKLTKPQFVANSTILIPEKSDGLNMKDLFQGSSGSNSNNIFNQIEIIKSYYNVNQTLINLNWSVSWYEKDLFIWRGIYKQEPFDVKETANFINPKGIEIFITPINGNSFNVKVEGRIKLGNAVREINFESTGTFGSPFVNQYFNFTLMKKANGYENIKGKYYFTFNDINSQTLNYLGRIKSSLSDKKSDIILCSVQGEEPERAVEFLNELIRVYSNQKMNVQNEAQRRSLDFINTQLNGITDSLNTAGTKFADFRSKNNIIDLGAEGTLVMNNLKEIESAKAQSQMQLDYFQNLLKYLDNSSDLKQLVSPSVVGIQDASLNALVLKMGELYNRRQVLSFSAKENNPTLVMLDKELNQIRNQLNENLKNLIDNASANIKSQNDRQDKISVQLNRLPQKEQKMVNIQRQFNLTNEIYTFLLQKRAETNIALASSVSDVQVIDIARPETSYTVGFGGSKVMMIGFFLGFGIPLAYLILFNFFDNRIRSQEDLEKNTTIPILGNIMHSPNNNDLDIYNNPKSNIAESFRVLRTNLQFMLTGPIGKVISVHSTNPGEGKSFSSINLATILAMNNKKVLLIGADMRKPRLHKVFNMDNEHGLSTYLIGKESIEQITFPTMVENLSLIPAGPIPPNPAEILSKPEMKELVETIRTQFDYIIIDNAPSALVTDGHIVSHLSDLNIFILRYGVSHKHQIEIINQYLEKKTIDNVALLVNDIKSNAFGHSYYKYYQYESYQNSYYAEDKKTKRKSNKITS
jgi:tyrosine-protein kinase Etk/Wzc